MTDKPKRIERYYDYHEIPGSDGVSQTIPHAVTVQYLWDYFYNLFFDKPVGMFSRVPIHPIGEVNEDFDISKGPDLAIIDGITDLRFYEFHGENEYYIGENKPPPKLIIEVTSQYTCDQDLEEKPAFYQAMGVNEYFAFGPYESYADTWKGKWESHNRLVGWRRNKTSGEYEMLTKDAAGRLWSEEAASWLVVKRKRLRIYNSESEDLPQGIDLVEQENLMLDHDYEEINREKEAAYRGYTEAKRKREAEQRRIEKMEDLLRKLGHNPDELI